MTVSAPDLCAHDSERTGWFEVVIRSSGTLKAPQPALLDSAAAISHKPDKNDRTEKSG